MTPAADARAIERSLELAAEQCDDLTPLVYRRLFAEHPEMEALFLRDAKGLVKGEMLSRAFEAILDFIGPRRYAHHFIQCEVITHAGYDVPPEVFRLFFGVVARSLKEVLGGDWGDQVDAAWARLLADLDFYVTHPDQAATVDAAV